VRKIFSDFKPNAVFGVGGYSSYPVLKFAQAKNISTFIHESNAFAGKSNIWLGKNASIIFTGIKGMDQFFPAEKIMITGNPVRKNIIEKTGIENPNIYGCIQIFIKIHPFFIDMLNEILKDDENAVIVLLSSKKGDKDDIIITNYIQSKIKYIERIHFIYQAPFIEYAKL
jgi:UDP-N-acetylglucosamine:LPS N-acetylglucosamine transferase